MAADVLRSIASLPGVAVTAPKKCRVVGVLVEQEPNCPDCAELRGPAAPSAGGPAQVATDAFREGWARTFSGKPAPRGQS